MIVSLAIYGCPFWQGCLKSFAVLVGTAKVIRAVKKVGVFVTLLGRVSAATIQFIIALFLLKVC
jgi:hypothetical protein